MTDAPEWITVQEAERRYLVHADTILDDKRHPYYELIKEAA